jgi:hypothetical protein
VDRATENGWDIGRCSATPLPRRATMSGHLVKSIINRILIFGCIWSTLLLYNNRYKSSKYL